MADLFAQTRVEAPYPKVTADFHITGSYELAAKYTGYLDFSDASPVEYRLQGTFGAYLNSGSITFDPSAAGKEIRPAA